MARKMSFKSRFPSRLHREIPRWALSFKHNKPGFGGKPDHPSGPTISTGEKATLDQITERQRLLFSFGFHAGFNPRCQPPEIRRGQQSLFQMKAAHILFASRPYSAGIPNKASRNESARLVSGSHFVFDNRFAGKLRGAAEAGSRLVTSRKRSS